MVSDDDAKKRSHIIYKDVDYSTDKTSMSGREIRSLVNFTSKRTMIVSVTDIEEKEVADNDVIEINGTIKIKEDPGLTRGSLEPRIAQEIELLEQNIANEIEHETTNDGTYIMIKDYSLNFGWNEHTIDILFKLPAGYPSVKPDCFLVPFGFALSSGGSVEAYSGPVLKYGDRDWGQFSYHITTWNPTADIASGHNLITFVNAIKKRLKQLN